MLCDENRFSKPLDRLETSKLNQPHIYRASIDVTWVTLLQCQPACRMGGSSAVAGVCCSYTDIAIQTSLYRQTASRQRRLQARINSVATCLGLHGALLSVSEHLYQDQHLYYPGGAPLQSPRTTTGLKSREISEWPREVSIRKSRYTDRQILAILKQNEEGAKVPDLCREHGMSTPMFYKRRVRFGGMDASMIKRMKEDVRRREAQSRDPARGTRKKW